MAYQVLARKWRPQDFDSVVGQGPVVQALRNGLADGRIAQAYLFSGIRGIGKTSVARVLAKALNCRTGPPPDPCNECQACTQITAGSDLDVLEIDAATYSKVEQVRELTDSLQYGPASDKYKVVIIDEIHRLSRQAFDALLKIVEEPPPHLVFIFATTESEAVPATILSRCQTFQFRRVPLAQMVGHLDRVAQAEEIEVSEQALHLIARAAEGSVRDGIALLDQLSTFGGGKIADDEVGRILGGVDLALFLDLLRAIVAGDRNGVGAFIRRVEEAGWDPRHVYGQFLAYCRDALHLALDPQNARVDLPSEEAESLAATAAETGYENLLRLLNLLLDSELTVRRSESSGLALEIALLRAAELPKLTAIEELLSRGGGSAPERSATPAPRREAGETGRAASREARRRQPSTAPPPPGEGSPKPRPSADRAASRASASSAKPDPETPSEPQPSEAPAAVTPDASEATPATGETDAGPADSEAEADSEDADQPSAESLPTPELGQGGEAIRELLERISYHKQSLAAHLNSAQSLALSEGALLIYAMPGDSVLEKTLRRPSNRKLLEETLADLLGPGVEWKIRPGESQPADDPEQEEDAETRVSEDPRVQTVLDLFDGEIDSIEQRDESRG